MPAKPLPVSKPLAAGSDSMAPARGRLELVEHGLTEPGGHAPVHALDHAAQRVAVAPGRLDGLDHQAGRGRVGQRVGPASTSSRVTAVIVFKSHHSGYGRDLIAAVPVNKNVRDTPSGDPADGWWHEDDLCGRSVVIVNE